MLGHPARVQRDRAIADELHISESTVKFPVTNLLAGLGAGIAWPGGRPVPRSGLSRVRYRRIVSACCDTPSHDRAPHDRASPGRAVGAGGGRGRRGASGAARP
ncbi:hypothetical protein AB0M87_25665 [Streptomyces sp. NPDC051320]|uniref:hypothetical protein n=1 Tax=Streptomyces sp. NPDC051320 TaxID=3154644 RepID=UPI003420F326